MLCVASVTPLAYQLKTLYLNPKIVQENACFPQPLIIKTFPWDGRGKGKEGEVKGPACLKKKLDDHGDTFKIILSDKRFLF